MVGPPLPPDEADRLASLAALNLLDTPAEERFDRITRVAAAAFDTPIALITLLDGERQWFKASVGVPRGEIPREQSFCGYTILGDEPFVVSDAAADPRFADNPYVAGEPGIRFYAGYPLDDGNGHKLGSLCLVGQQPRTMSPSDLALLKELAGWAEQEIRSANLVQRRRLAEEALRRSEEIHRTVVAAMVEGVVILDSDGVLLGCNTAAERILGLTREQLAGDRPKPDGWQLSSADGTALPANRLPIVAGDDVLLGVSRAGGVTRWISGNSRPVRRDDDLEPWGVVYTFSDVTGRLTVDRMKSEFVSVVSHELRTPLTSIRGALGLLASGALGPLGERSQQMMDIAVLNTDRLVRLINDILDIERIESGKAALNRKQISDVDMISQAVEVMRPMADRADIRLTGRTHGADVYADPDRTIQTLTNLISNGIKFSPSGGLVEVTTELVGDEVVFQVSDHGRGIPKDKQPLLFQRFQQVDVSDAREKGGSGLGLAICKSIVEQHGGRIWMDSTPGAGTTFRFTLPVYRRPADAPDLTGHHIVCWLPDETLAALLPELRDTLDAQLVAVTSYQDIVRSVREYRADAVLLDLDAVGPGGVGCRSFSALRERLGSARATIVAIESTDPGCGVMTLLGNAPDRGPDQGPEPLPAAEAGPGRTRFPDVLLHPRRTTARELARTLDATVRRERRPGS